MIKTRCSFPFRFLFFFFSFLFRFEIYLVTLYMYNTNRYIQHREFALSCTCNGKNITMNQIFRKLWDKLHYFAYKVGTQKSKRILYNKIVFFYSSYAYHKRSVCQKWMRFTRHGVAFNETLRFTFQNLIEQTLVRFFSFLASQPLEDNTIFTYTYCTIVFP